MITPRRLRWLPFWTLFKREVARFLKVAVQTVLTPLISTSLYLMIFGLSLGQQIRLDSGLTYMAFLIPGLVMMSCLNGAFQNTSSSIISSKFSGDLEDLKAAPLSALQIVLAMNLAAVVRGLLVGAITLLVGEICYRFAYGEFMGVSHPLELMAFLLVGATVFANIGVAVAFWARTFDHLSGVSGLIMMPLIYLGGVFFSIQHLPDFWKSVAKLNPLLYMINGVRHGFLGVSDVDPQKALALSLVALLLTGAWAWRCVTNGSFQRW